jgi:hypothetical protein
VDKGDGHGTAAPPICSTVGIQPVTHSCSLSAVLEAQACYTYQQPIVQIPHIREEVDTGTTGCVITRETVILRLPMARLRICNRR